ncbi:MAG: helix-turn-helix transcriptional regulator, partial [Clostridia bacterium]|nr:helix-turn-helix transcriptional regulator [Clostridia bacterium]
ASRYQGNDKSMLYEFFLDPTPYIETLRYTLMEKELLLSCFHKENYDKILEAHNNTTYEILCEPIKETISLKLFNDIKTFYTSYCLLNKCCMKFSFILDGVLYFLGCDYATILEELKNRDLEEPSLEALCFALGEESRMRIAEVLLAKGEATCKDVEMEFQFSGSTAYHHLSILVRAGVVKIRTAGKTIYYSINKEHFKVMGKALKKFSDS